MADFLELTTDERAGVVLPFAGSGEPRRFGAGIARCGHLRGAVPGELPVTGVAGIARILPGAEIVENERRMETNARL
ncbi:hypothetical protein [Saccharopolyspora kobensis]|uniref:hypothetical protein n=1 Tax=Saccharopolyspora kobensis TaxID=146035 RepID=UPI001160F700|nr:hypothetical protein [Saccharopolyspora kobensis]